MKKRKLKDNTATLYWFKIKDLEKTLGKEKRERKRIETELEKERKKREEGQNKLKELEKKLGETEKRIRERDKIIGEQDKEIENLKWTKQTYAKMIFKGNTKQVKSPKRGQKKGHIGVSRKKPDEELIENEIDVVLKECPHCEATLRGCKRRYERVVEDIMVQPRRVIKKYWIHQYKCHHCGENISAKSADIIGQSPFGKKIFSTVLFYKYRMKSPISKIEEALREIHGLTISQGGIQNLLYQAAAQFGEKYEELKSLIQAGKIVHADETGWRVNGENWWNWLWSNDDIILYTTQKSRGGKIAQIMLESFKGLLNRDGHGAYNSVETEQQICWVHLLRRAHHYSERENASQQMVLLKDILKKSYHRMDKWHRKKHSDIERLKFYEGYKKILANLAHNTIWTEDDAKKFIQTWLIKHSSRLVNFLKYSYACSHNNPAERAIRPMVILRKITGGSKSERGIKATDINMSIIETWAKQNLSLIQQLPVFGFNP